MKRTLVSLLVAVSITMTACGGAGSSSQGQQADAAQETAKAGQAAQDEAAPEQAEQAAQDAAEAGQEAAEPAKEDAAGEITYVVADANSHSRKNGSGSRVLKKIQICIFLMSQRMSPDYPCHLHKQTLPAWKKDLKLWQKNGYKP